MERAHAQNTTIIQIYFKSCDQFINKMYGDLCVHVDVYRQLTILTCKHKD